MKKGRWWNVRKLPTGGVQLRLDPAKIRLPMAADAGIRALNVGLAYWLLRSFSPLLALATTALSVARNGRSLLRRLPTSWRLAPGRATLRGWNGKERGTYAPARVILMRRENRHDRFSHTSYALFLETLDGEKVAIHRGLPRQDRHELARVVGQALRVTVVEQEWAGIRFGPT